MDIQVDKENLTITQQYDSARELNEAKARATYEANKNHGLIGAVENVLRGIGSTGDLISVHRVMFIISIILVVVAGVYAYNSFSKIMPNSGFLTILFGVVGCLLVIAGKTAASNLAKEVYQKDRTEAMIYGGAVMFTFFVLVVIGSAYQAGIEEDKQAGVIDTTLTIQDKEKQLREIGYELEEMRHNEKFRDSTSDDLALDLTRALSRSAYNTKNDAVGPVGDFLNVGTDEFCVGRSYYVEKYCPDILELESLTKFRLQYEDKVSEQNTLREEVAVLRSSRPQSSSIMSLSKTVTQERWHRYAIAALFFAFIDICMIGAAYLSTWTRLVSENRKVI